MTPRLWVILCGSREWDDIPALEFALGQLVTPLVRKPSNKTPVVDDVVVMHGGQTSRQKRADGTERVYGADHQWELAAKHIGVVDIRSFPVDWKAAARELGLGYKSAGMRRNARMLDSLMKESSAQDYRLVIAAHDDPRLGRGTRDMVKRAMAEGLAAWWIRHEDAAQHRRTLTEIRAVPA